MPSSAVILRIGSAVGCPSSSPVLSFPAVLPFKLPLLQLGFLLVAVSLPVSGLVWFPPSSLCMFTTSPDALKVKVYIYRYMSEIAPKAIRGAIVAGYQWAITLVRFFHNSSI